MENNIYTFNSEIRRKAKGGGIGSNLTGAVASIRQIRFAREFRRKVNAAARDMEGFEIYKMDFYIDDGDIGSEAFPPGSRYEGGKIVVVQEDAESDNKADDGRTAEIFRAIGNTIVGDISITVDYPSKNEDGWMPLLDCQMKVEENKIQYKFFKKPMATPLVMMQTSALPAKVKRESLTQEVIRRLRNTKRSLPWEVKAEILSEFSNSMRRSGYSEEFRLDVIRSGICSFERICQTSDEGGTPLFRPREYQSEERKRKKLMTKSSWYRPHNAVGFYPVTPGGELAETIRNIVDEEAGRLGLRIKIAETGGPSMKAKLTSTDLSGCPVPACPLCERGEGGASHTRSGALYKGTCKLCDKIYYGETGDNGVTRIGQHRKAIQKRDSGNAFAKHLLIDHPDQQGDQEAFDIKVEKVFKKPLERQVMEGVMIAATDPDKLMNSKAEYLQPAVVRISATRELSEQEEPRRKRTIGRRN